MRRIDGRLDDRLDGRFDDRFDDHRADGQTVSMIVSMIISMIFSVSQTILSMLGWLKNKITRGKWHDQHDANTMRKKVMI